MARFDLAAVWSRIASPRLMSHDMKALVKNDPRSVAIVIAKPSRKSTFRRFSFQSTLDARLSVGRALYAIRGSVTAAPTGPPMRLKPSESVGKAIGFRLAAVIPGPPVEFSLAGIFFR